MTEEVAHVQLSEIEIAICNICEKVAPCWAIADGPPQVCGECLAGRVEKITKALVALSGHFCKDRPCNNAECVPCGVLRAVHIFVYDLDTHTVVMGARGATPSIS